ncbi:MAG: NAD+ synthase [Candidatus Omnitrophota bacterium]
MRITVAQLNPALGDIEKNFEKIVDVLSEKGKETDLIVFSELFLSGYPAKDFFKKNEFMEHIQSALDRILILSKNYPDTGILVGIPLACPQGVEGGVCNSVVLVYQGKVLDVRSKMFSGKNEFFNEAGFFSQVPDNHIITFKGKNLGVVLGDDVLNFSELNLAQEEVSIVVNMTATPFSIKTINAMHNLIKEQSEKYNIPFLFVNQVGAADELIFDGGSFYVNEKGETVLVCPFFEEHVETVETELSKKIVQYTAPEEISGICSALKQGIRDYINKNGFSKAVIGLSGGIDSAVTCVLAEQAIGAENVLGIAMPSKYSAKQSEEYSLTLSKNLGIKFETIPINGIYDAYIKTLKKQLAVDEEGDVEVYLQNIQARIRGNILMSFSNKHEYMVLATGNKSEVLTGYCTLYGDTVGGLAVIADLSKTMVYKLALYLNRDSEIIPKEIIERAPSAELKPGQKDQDTLPPYDVLDAVLFYLEEGCSMREIEQKGFDKKTVEWVVKRIKSNEYKRRQLPLALRINM